MPIPLSLLIHGEQTKYEFNDIPDNLEIITFTGNNQYLHEEEARVLFNWIRNDYSYLSEANWKNYSSQIFLINETTTTINCYRTGDLCPNLTLYFVPEQTYGPNNVLGFYDPSVAKLANARNMRPTEGRLEDLTTKIYNNVGNNRFTLEYYVKNILSPIIPRNTKMRLYLFCCRGGEAPQHYMNVELIPTHRITNRGIIKIPTPNNMNMNGGYRRRSRNKAKRITRRRSHKK
jgi:hypothetical protein